MTLDEKILDLVKRYMEKLFQKKMLKTMEEVEANTNDTNMVSAPVFAELNNKLMSHPDFIYDTSGKITGYKTPGGADTVFPFTRIDKGRGTTSASGYYRENLGYRPKYFAGYITKVTSGRINDTAIIMINGEISPMTDTANTTLWHFDDTGFTFQGSNWQYSRELVWFAIP